MSASTNNVRQPDIAAAVADELPVGVWVAKAPTGELLYANRRFQEIMGMAARDDVAAGEYAEPYGIRDLDGNPYPEDKLPFVRALVSGTTVVVDDIVIHRTDGAKVYIRAFGKPVRDATGDVGHVIVAFIDKTREVEAENARAESERRLRHAQRMEAIGNLAGGIAHDFNNLLAGLKLLAAGLALHERDPERVSSFNAIDELTERAASLTRGLLGFAGQGKYRSAPVGLNPMVHNLVGIFRRTLLGAATVETRLDAPGDAVVIGDASQLEQVLMNLVVNARDAVRGGDRAGRIVIATHAVEVAVGEAAAVAPGRWMVIEVIDNGPGIPADLRERVFEPYFTTRTSGPTPGVGLGLATVFGVVDRHGGAVVIDDAPGGGALLRVYLPAGGLERVPPPVPAPAATRMTGAGPVLIVDDEPLVRAALGRVLTLAGYQVTAVGSGAEAVELVRASPGRFKAIVLDLVMPGMDGRATYQAVRAIDRDVPVLLVSGHAANEEVQAMLDLGVRAFLPKPCSLHALSAAMAAMVGSTRRTEGSD